MCAQLRTVYNFKLKKRVVRKTEIFLMTFSSKVIKTPQHFINFPIQSEVIKLFFFLFSYLTSPDRHLTMKISIKNI